jgi:hypothetical protein
VGIGLNPFSNILCFYTYVTGLRVLENEVEPPSRELQSVDQRWRFFFFVALTVVMFIEIEEASQEAETVLFAHGSENRYLKSLADSVLKRPCCYFCVNDSLFVEPSFKNVGGRFREKIPRETTIEGRLYDALLLKFAAGESKKVWFDTLVERTSVSKLLL